MSKLRFLGSLALVAGTLFGACAESPPPATAQVDATSHSIGAAEGARAGNVPAAEYHLALAKEQSAQAERLLADGYTDRGKLMLLRADADARLAYALARQAGERSAAEKAINRVHELQRGAQ